MSSVPFIDGESTKKYIDVNGSGTTGDPYVFIFRFPDGYSLPLSFDASTALKIRDGNAAGNLLAIDTNGVITIKYVDDIAATSPNAATGLIGLIRGMWSSITQIGTANDVANSTGSIHAKLRYFIADTLGATADAASPTGGLMARMRLIAQSYTSPNIFTRWGTSNGDTISGTPARVTGLCVWNKSSSIRYVQLFNRTSNATNGTVPLFSRALAPNEKYTLATIDMGSVDGLVFTTGLAWAFSTTEATLTLGTNIEVSIDIFWRST